MMVFLDPGIEPAGLPGSFNRIHQMNLGEREERPIDRIKRYVLKSFPHLVEDLLRRRMIHGSLERIINGETLRCDLETVFPEPFDEFVRRKLSISRRGFPILLHNVTI
jgi:hypothetical protein